MATTTVEIDSDLLARLRERSPGKSDRELLEELATVTLGFETIQRVRQRTADAGVDQRSEEHTSELQSLRHLVCRLLLENNTLTAWAATAVIGLRVWRLPGSAGVRP